MEELVEFVRGRGGYVLEFGDTTFSEFFAAELDVDIDDPVYAELGSSKGKRLRCFLTKVDDETALKTLRALWDHRVEYLARSASTDPVLNAEGRFLTLVARIGAQPGDPLGVPPRPAQDLALLNALRDELLGIRDLQPHTRGYAFEAFLKRYFEASGLRPREPFRNIGEQIDGSFVLGDEVYLVEAKWHAASTPAADLHVFHGKLEQKAAWARGLFVSYNGFTPEGLTAFGFGKRIVCLEGRDIHDALGRQLPLKAVLEAKIRHAAEHGQVFAPVSSLFS